MLDISLQTKQIMLCACTSFWWTLLPSVSRLHLTVNYLNVILFENSHFLFVKRKVITVANIADTKPHTQGTSTAIATVWWYGSFPSSFIDAMIEPKSIYQKKLLIWMINTTLLKNNEMKFEVM